MRWSRPIMTVLMMLAGAMVFGGLVTATDAVAQEGPGGLISPGRDCQTVRNCSFRRDGRFRGCVSSYSCRVCRPVRSACAVGGSRRTCSRLECSWG
ncbi:MAG: hypothetical protein NW217_03560 [Hyphomicrobiaceae bacterium]|nr:hypothetical protein [Hyphomicrobiaceae bacterium]